MLKTVEFKKAQISLKPKEFIENAQNNFKKYISVSKLYIKNFNLLNKIQKNSKKFELSNQYSKYYLDSRYYKKHRRGGMVMYKNNFMDDSVVDKMRRKIERGEYFNLDSETEIFGSGIKNLNRNFLNEFFLFRFP